MPAQISSNYPKTPEDERVHSMLILGQSYKGLGKYLSTRIFVEEGKGTYFYVFENDGIEQYKAGKVLKIMEEQLKAA